MFFHVKKSSEIFKIFRNIRKPQKLKEVEELVTL